MTFHSGGDISPTTITSPIATWRRSSLPLSSSSGAGLQHTSKIRRRAVAGFVVCLVLFLWVTSSSYRARRSQGVTSWRAYIQQATAKHTGMAAAAAASTAGGTQPKLIKLSMLYGEPNEQYERALETQRKHSERWGHELRVLREDMVGEFGNKPAYLLSTIIAELAKPREERAEWIMWVDADSIILNPAVPPELFLPPHELPDVHMVATRDRDGLNAGLLFLRVHPWSVSMLTSTTAYPQYNPDDGGGEDSDAEAMRRVLRWEDGGWADRGYRDNMVYAPGAWINAYQWDRGYEGNRGDFLVRFGHIREGGAERRAARMDDWLATLAAHPADWEVRPEETGLAANATFYWEAVQTATQAVQVLQAKCEGMPGGTEEEKAERQRWANTTQELQTLLWEHADNVEMLRVQTHNLVAGDL